MTIKIYIDGESSSSGDGYKKKYNKNSCLLYTSDAADE